MCLSCAGRVVEIDADTHEAFLDVDGEMRTVSLAILTLEGRNVAIGEWVLVHTGFAMEVLDPAVASELISLHREVTGLDEPG